MIPHLEDLEFKDVPSVKKALTETTDASKGVMTDMMTEEEEIEGRQPYSSSNLDVVLVEIEEEMIKSASSDQV
jgi:hypothetical protein